MERKKIAFFRKVKNLWKKAFEIIEYPRIAFKILINRYLIFSFVSFIIMYKFVFGEMNSLESVRYYCAVAVLGFVVIFLGKRGVLYSYFICLGFFVSLICFKKDWNVGFLEIFLISVFSVCFVIGKMYNDKKVKEKIISEFKSEKDLYSKRLDPFNAILEYISNHSVIGIDSPYGNGKSTVVEVLRRKKQDWEFITIGILSTTLENVEFCIIREINRVLESYGVFSNPISKVKSFFSHDFAYCVGDFLFESQSYEEQIRNYVDDIQGIRKVIVLNFEDIDRITNIEHLNKIFAICDSLTKLELKYKPEKRFIKVIYQYKARALDKLFMEKYGDERYTEKYIPHSVCLPELTGDFFNYVLKKNKGKYTMIEKYKGNKDYIFNFLSQSLEIRSIKKHYSLELDNHTVRGVEYVLDKVNAALDFFKNEMENVNNNHNILNRIMNEHRVGDGQKLEFIKTFYFETILLFNITRYFFPNMYNVLKKGVGMESQKIFYDRNDRPVSLVELRERLWRKNEEKTKESIYNSSEPKSDMVNDFFNEFFNQKTKDNVNALIILFLLAFDSSYKNNDCEILLGAKGPENEDLIEIIRLRNKIWLRLMDLH